MRRRKQKTDRQVMRAVELKSVIKAADQASVIRPLANSRFQQGRAGDKARMTDCALIIEGPESLAEWSGFHPEWNKQPQKALRRTGTQ